MKKFDIHRWWIPGKSMSVVFVPLGIWTFVYFIASVNRFLTRMDLSFNSIGWSPVYGWRNFSVLTHDMPQFNHIMSGCFSGYWLVLLICVLLILERYLWIRRDRSIYIMNRIPAAETFRRCALLLLIYAAAVLVLTLIVIVLLKARYMAVVPEEIMPPDEPIRPFDALLFKGRFNFEPWDFNV